MARYAPLQGCPSVRRREDGVSLGASGLLGRAEEGT